MDDTMSSYSFSQHFYQRWTCAPEPIRAAITQELKDITALLQTETPFESFVFHTHDLDAHVDELYENHEAEQAIAKAITEKQDQEQAAAEKLRIEEKQRVEEEKRKILEDAKLKEVTKLKEEAKLREAAEATQNESENNALLVADQNNPDESPITTNESNKISADSDVANSTGQITTENTLVKASSETKTISEHANAIGDTSIKNDNTVKKDTSVKAINSKASAAISLALKDAKSNVTHQELIRELEMQIDDYLSDQMMLMSENLKSWLRAEVTQHLGEQITPVTNEEVAKKNIH